MAVELFIKHDLSAALEELRTKGQLDSRGLDGLRKRVGRNAELLRAIEELQRGNDVPDVFTLTDAEKRAVIKPPTPMTTGAALKKPDSATKVQAGNGSVWKIGDLPHTSTWFNTTLYDDGGALELADTLAKKRGGAGGAKNYEKRSSVGYIVSEDSGGFSPSLFMREQNAVATTGIDFISKAVKTHGLPILPGTKIAVDFMDGASPIGVPADAQWVAVKQNRTRSHNLSAGLFGSATAGEELTSDYETVVKGNKVFAKPVFKDKNGKVVDHSDVMIVAKQNGKIVGDGKVSSTTGMSTTWWGSCYAVAAAGAMFEAPKHAVTIDGVTFSTERIKELLAAAVRDLASRPQNLAGHDFEETDDMIVLKGDKVLEGKIDIETKDLLRNDTTRSDGMIITRGSNRAVTIVTSEGKKTVPASEILAIVREDKHDISPMEFDEIVMSRLSRGKAISMDKDGGIKVANVSFDTAEREVTHDKPWFADEPKELVGHNGPWRGGRVEWVTMELSRNGSGDETYKYWLERDASGKVVNGGWRSDSPDRLWAVDGKPFEGPNTHNPKLDYKLVKEIYEASLTPEPKKPWYNPF